MLGKKREGGWGLALLLVALMCGSARPEATLSKQVAEVAPHKANLSPPPRIIAKALETARAHNQRVLLIWGAPWCGWCKKLHHLFKKNRTLSHTLLYEYVVADIDVGHFDRHLDLAARYGAPIKQKGIPYLTILDARGKLLANQATTPFEKEGSHDPTLVQAFLARFKAVPRDAGKLLKIHQAQALAAGKNHLIYLRAPW